LGGVGKLADFADAFTIAGVSAVSAASIFHFTDQSPIKVNFFLKTNGICVR
jgi:cyclase